MPDIVSKVDLLAAFIISGLVAYLITPLVRLLAIRMKLLDHPSERKVHIKPTPLFGGVSIFIAFLSALIFTAKFTTPILGIVIGGLILLIIGIIDDRIAFMPPHIKLLGQLLAALTVVKFGVRVAFVSDVYLSMLFTYFWIISITNAFNLLDNMNGLSAGVAGISAVIFGLLSLYNGQLAVSLLSFALAGGCFGFLKHNFPKASIFMGDAGSMFIGFTFASIAVLGSWKTPNVTFSIMVPILVLAYPIFDTTLVSIMRVSRGQSIFAGGKDHSSHRLISLGFSEKKAVMFIYLISLILGVSAFIVTISDPVSAAISISAIFLLLFILGVRLALVDANFEEWRLKRWLQARWIKYKMPFYSRRKTGGERTAFICDKITEWSLCAAIIAIPVSNAFIEIFIAIAFISWATKKVLASISKLPLSFDIKTVAKGIRLPDTYLDMPILALIVTTVLSITNTTSVSSSFNYLFFKLGEYIALFYMVVEIFNSERKIRNVTGFLVFSCAIVSLNAVFQYVAGFDLLRHFSVSAVSESAALSFAKASVFAKLSMFRDIRVTSSFFMPEDFAAWLLVILPVLFTILFFVRPIRGKARIALAGLFVFLFVLFLSASSKGAWLGLASALFFALFIKKRKLALVLAVCFILLPSVLPDSVAERVESSMTSQDNGDGVYRWQVTWNAIKSHPVFGIGADVYHTDYLQYSPREGKGLSGYTNSSFLQYAADMGLIGIGALLWFLFMLFSRSIRNLGNIKEPFYHSLLLGLLGGILAFLIHSLFRPDFRSLQLMVLFWFAVGLSIAVQRAALRKENLV
ncbi:MAG: hypothetical protein AUJ75_01175 [Candidatus Omnitrophica bacterium CG1_02_49_10]|nr:MAG: hypothetical protein AUJ75_01175 [Candidatus Omnitrophica bacterium CG1_02_49_10]